MELIIKPDELKVLVREVVAEVLSSLDWPANRLVLTECEAAACCGVARHTLRDLRLAGRIKARKLGKKVVYARGDLLQAIGIGFGDTADGH